MNPARVNAIFTILMAGYYFYSIPDNHASKVFAACSISLQKSKVMSIPAFGETYLFYFYLFNRTLVFPVLILVTLGYFLHTRKKKWLFLFLAVLLVGGFYAISQLSRAPIAAIIMRILVFLLLFYRGDVNLRKLVLAALLMLSYPLIVTMTYVSDRTILDGILAVVIRLTYTPAEDLYYYFEIFPTHHVYLYGETLIKPFLKLLELDYFYIENWVALYISPRGLDSAHANAAFISNFHADFGLPGVFVGGLITAMAIQWIQIKLFRWEKSVYNMTIFAVFIYSIWALNFGSITSVLFVNGVIPVFLLIFGLKFLTSIFNLTKPTKKITNGYQKTGELITLPYVEEEYLEQAVEAIINNGYPLENLDILIVDGESTDSTLFIAEKLAKKYEIVRVFNNPRKILASAWNIGIENCSSDFVIAGNAHAKIEKNHFSKLADLSLKHPADCYAPMLITHPQDDTAFGKAVGGMMSHKFGVGNSEFRTSTGGEPSYVDTAHLGAYRREVFLSGVRYNEEMVRSQDVELHKRLRFSGKKLLLCPSVKVHYYTRSNPKGFFKFGFINGYWVTKPMQFGTTIASLRHLIPSIFAAQAASSISTFYFF